MIALTKDCEQEVLLEPKWVFRGGSGFQQGFYGSSTNEIDEWSLSL